jgi:hypothetical protein
MAGKLAANRVNKTAVRAGRMRDEGPKPKTTEPGGLEGRKDEGVPLPVAGREEAKSSEEAVVER